MNDDEIRKQNRDTLLERMNESGNAHSSDYPYGLMMEAEEEIKQLRAELKTILAERDEADANNNAFRKVDTNEKENSSMDS